MDNRVPGTALVKVMPQKLDKQFKEFTQTYAGEEYRSAGSDLGLWYGAVFERLKQKSSALTDAERKFVDTILADSWRKAVETYGPDPSAWQSKAVEQYRQRTLKYHQDLAGFPSLYPDFDLPEPDLYDNEQLTLLSQQGQTYSQSVSMHDPDAALALEPIGASERPASPYRLSTYQIWAEGKFHPAPLSRAAVDKLTTQRTDLSAEYQSVR
jgi:acyl-homoserine lactone acylase PvdQ